MAVFIGKLDTSSGLPAIPMAAADPNGLDTILLPIDCFSSRMEG
jgi:hypothetical protein